jgi:hypothetical protein
VLAGSDCPLVISSGVAILPAGRLSTEETVPPSGPTTFPRVASEEAAASLAARGMRASVLRLPPSVHGDCDHGFVPLLIDVARQADRLAVTERAPGSTGDREGRAGGVSPLSCTRFMMDARP